MDNRIKESLVEIPLPQTSIICPSSEVDPDPFVSVSNVVHSLVVNIDNDTRPYVNINVLGWDLCGLLDTGASCTVLGVNCEELIFKLNLAKCETRKTISTADGSSHIIKSSVYLPIGFNNEIKVLSVLLAPNIAKPLILGMDFFKLFNFEIGVPSNQLFSLTEFVEPMLPKVPVDFSLIESVKSKFPVSKGGILSCTHLLQYNIDTGTAKPIKQKHHFVSPYMQQTMNEELDRMLKLNVVEPSKSAWANPIVCVKKKNGKTRLCLDSRRLNEVTVKDSYPIAYISRILGRLNGTKYLSSIDLSDAFWQIPLDEQSKPKTAFVVPGRGLFHFKRMPFGLCNAAQNLSKLMDSVLGYDLEPNVFCYLDDIIVATNDFSEHLRMLNIVAERLSNANLTINLEKSKFCVPQLPYLGYILDKDGIHVDSEKVQCIIDYPVPKTLKEVRRFLGMCGWYRRFIVDFSEKTAQISDLLKKSKKFCWTKEADEAFLHLKSALITAPILASPDFTKPFYVQCDASNLQVGGLIFQIIDGNERVIAYTSQKLTSTQQKYMACERELLAVLHCVNKFRPYIEGCQFTVITDNSALLWLKTLKDPTGRLARWALKLQHYDYVIIHRPGKLNVVADALSRAVVEVLDSSATEVDWYEKLRNEVFTSKTKGYKIHNSSLFKEVLSSPGNLGQGSSWKLVVPPAHVNNVLVECHDSPTAGHLGVKKTIKRVKEKYFWPEMVKQITHYVKNCERCKCCKYPTQISRPLMGKPKEANEPWEMILMDFIGPFTRSKRGNTVIFVVIDFLTKFVLLKPMRSGKTPQVIKYLEDDVFLTYNVPRIVISDNGPQFISKQFASFLTSYNVTHWLTSRYTPQYNSTERVNRVIMSCIRSYIAGQQHDKWDDNIQQIACAIRTAVHDTTLYSPYFINFGRNMILNGNQYEKFIQDPSKPINQLAEDKAGNLKTILDSVKDNIKKSSSQVAKRYNLRAKPIEFNVGDVVYKRNFALSNAIKGQSAKLNDPFIKCYVKKRMGSNTYLLEDLNRRPLGIFHAKDIHE